MPKLHRLRDVDPVAIALCKKGANGQRIFLRKSEAELVTIADRMELHKASADGDWTTLYCVVAQPEARENGGMLDPDKVDVWDSEDEIRKAAHRLVKNRGEVNLEHGDKAEAHIVESAVALAPIALEDITIPTGAWYVGIEPSAELRKSYDAGELTGVSLEGTGVREEAGEVEEESPASLFERLAKAFKGQGLRGQTGTLATRSDEESSDVDTAQMETKFEEFAKAQTAHSTAIQGLVDTVSRLVTHFERTEKERAKREDEKEGTEGEEKTSPADLKKAIDELTATMAEKLDDLEGQVDKLADEGSTQHKEDLAKSKSDNPLAGLLN